MDVFQGLVLGALAVVIGLCVLLVLRGRGTEAETLRARLAEVQAALEASLATARADAAAQARQAREELSTGMDRLGDAVARAVTAIGQGQGERLDGLAKSVSNGRIESQNHATELRKELLGSFETLAASVGERMRTLGQDSGERLAGFGKALGEHRQAAATEADRLREGVTANLTALGKRLDDALDGAAKRQGDALGLLTGSVKEMADANERRGDGLRQTVEGRLDSLRQENTAKLDEMRATVDEKLQGTLTERLGASFSMVNENLERVHKSVGEMQQIATGVGDLKRVLSNVKTRGTWGETNLELLLEQVMAPEQYAKQVAIRPGAKTRVDFAIRLPGEGETPVWLPIDAKLPTEDYERLVEAADRGDAAGVEQAAKALSDSIRLCAKDISGKYIDPPHSTDFAIMFLPTEGLFAEVVRRPGLIDALHRDCKVVVAGPTTLLALLSSLRMGFRTLAVQKRSSEVWQVLGAVKTEFGKFGGILDKASKKLGEAQNVMEEARRKSTTVSQKLRSVEALPEAAAQATLAIAADDIADELEAAE